MNKIILKEANKPNEDFILKLSVKNQETGELLFSKKFYELQACTDYIHRYYYSLMSKE